MATAPTLKPPVGGAQIDSLAAHFTWNALPGTKTYRLQVAADDAFNQLVVDSNIGATNDVTVFDLIPPTGASMYWRVQAEGDAGWSAPERFTAARDNADVAPAATTQRTATPAAARASTTGATADSDVRPADYLTGTTSTTSLMTSVVVMVVTIAVVLVALFVGAPGM